MLKTILKTYIVGQGGGGVQGSTSALIQNEQVHKKLGDKSLFIVKYTYCKKMNM